MTGQAEVPEVVEGRVVPVAVDLEVGRDRDSVDQAVVRHRSCYLEEPWAAQSESSAWFVVLHSWE